MTSNFTDMEMNVQFPKVEEGRELFSLTSYSWPLQVRYHSHHPLSNPSISEINLNYEWNPDSILESFFVIPVSLLYLTHPFLSFSTSEYTLIKTEIKIYILF